MKQKIQRINKDHISLKIPLAYHQEGQFQKPSYGLDINIFNGTYFRFRIFHNIDVLWRFDLKWHISLLDILNKTFDVNHILLLEYFVIQPFGDDDIQVGASWPSERVIYNYLNEHHEELPFWIRRYKNVEYQPYYLLKFANFHKFLQHLNNQIDITREARADTGVKLPEEFSYWLLLFHNFNDSHYLQISYNWEGALSFEMPAMPLLINDLKTSDSPQYRRNTIPVSQLKKFVKIALDFLREEERYDEVYNLINEKLEDACK